MQPKSNHPLKGTDNRDGSRILLCSDYLPPSDGGVEQVVQKLAVHLADRGLDIGVFTLDDGTRNFDLRGHPDISLFTTPSVNLTDTIGLQCMFSVSALRDFKRVLWQFQPDIVHAHNRFFYTTALAAFYSRHADYELVTTLHLGDVDRISGIGGAIAKTYQKTVSRLVLSQSDLVICVSAAAEQTARALGAEHTAVVRNAVDTTEFTVHNTDEKSLLYVGRFIRNKGIQDLLTALPGILNAHPDAEVHLVGSGPLEAEVRKRIQSHELSDSVTIHGYVEDISMMYNNSSVFCRPSYSEGLPLTTLEAMASGVPPVVTAIAGVPEVVTNGETGVLIEPGNPDQITQGVVDLFDRPDFRERLSWNARQHIVENLTWQQRTKKVMKAYRLLEVDAR